MSEFPAESGADGAGAGRDFAFGDDLRQQLAANLTRHTALELPLRGRRHAAVAIVVVDSDEVRHGDDPNPAGPERMQDIPGQWPPSQLTGSVAGTAGGAAFLLTRRTPRLNAHGGQWALPGGRVDPSESPLGAARRELHEELGLDLGEDAVLGRLDDYPTRSGYVISPYVLWGGADPALAPSPHEVASVHRIALRELCRRDSPRFLTIPESERPVVQLPIGGDVIHAPTGALLYQFRRVGIEGVSERVHHLEQPVFAWR